MFPSKTIYPFDFDTRMFNYIDLYWRHFKIKNLFDFFSFYTQIYEQQFKQCMEFPAQRRYSIVFPMICGHFMNATHELCPEEV